MLMIGFLSLIFFKLEILQWKVLYRVFTSTSVYHVPDPRSELGDSRVDSWSVSEISRMNVRMRSSSSAASLYFFCHFCLQDAILVCYEIGDSAFCRRSSKILKLNPPISRFIGSKFKTS